MELTNIAPAETAVKAVAPIDLSSFSELLKQSLKMYEVLFKKVVTLALISALAIVPLMLIIFSFGFISGQPMAIKILLGILFVAALIFLIFVAVSTQAATLFLLEDGSRDLKELLKKGMGMAGALIAVSVLTGVLTLLWTLLLIIPGIIFSVYYSFSIYALVYEHQTGMSALRRSQQLVKNYWWSVVGRTIYLALLYLAAFIFISIPLYFLPEDSALAIFWNMVMSALRFATSPIFVIYSYLIFKELVSIKGSALTNAANKTV